MRAQRLFHHPVGVFPFGARWYLAGLSVLMLVLLAVHFVIHIQAQEHARQLIRGWMGEAHIDVAHVRYHLLRNALLLEDIRIRRGGVELGIGQALVRADAASLISEQPHLGHVELSGVRLVVGRPGDLQMWRDDARLGRIWTAIESMRFDQGELVMYPGGRNRPAMRFDAWSLTLQREAKLIALHGAAELAGAPVRVEATMAGTESWTIRGTWREGRAAPLMAALGWGDLPGLVSGDLGIRSQTGGRSRLMATIHLEDGNNRRSLIIEGVAGKDGWDLQVQAGDWPLAPWSAVLPVVHGKRLKQGWWRGRMRLTGGQGQWRGEGDGVLDDLAWAAGGRGEGALKQLRYRDMHWSSAGRKLHIGEAEMRGLDMRIGGKPASADAGWACSIGHAALRDTSIRLEMPRGLLELTGLAGEAGLGADGLLGFSLAGSGHGDAAGLWSLKGRLGLEQGRWRQGALEVEGRDVALQRLRPFLPLAGTEQTPLSIGGTATVSAAVVVTKGLWRMQGELDVAGLLLMHAGSQWRADRLRLEFGPVGSAVDVQQIGNIEAADWHYVLPMHPFTAMSQGRETAGAGHSSGPAWWARLLHRDNWVIRTLHFTKGIISLGRESSAWATDLTLEADGLQRNAFTSFRLRGDIDGGELSVRGRWNLLAGVPAFGMRARLRHARPFFLNEWLRASGMPGLIRGRLSASLDVDNDEASGTYVARASLRLGRGRVEDAVLPDDPLLAWLGYGLGDVLARLDDGRGEAHLAFEASGSWARGWPALGLAMREALRQKIENSQNDRDGMAGRDAAALYEARVRLHGSGGLSHNERARLRKLWRHLRTHKGWVLDIEPVWTGEQLEDAMVRRILYTQHLVESFMAQRGIHAGRIFPTLPRQQDHGEDLGYVHVLIRPAVASRAGGDKN